MEWQTLEGPFEHRHEDNKTHPVLPLVDSIDCILACVGVVCFTEGGKGGFVLRGACKIYLKVVRGKVTRVGDKRSRYFYYLWGQSWSIYWYSLPKWCNLVVLTPWSLWTPFGFTNTVCRTEAPRCTRLYSLFQFLHKGRNTADQGCDTKASMAVYPVQTDSGVGFKGAIIWHYRWTQWYCSGPAIAYCVTLIKSLPSSFCLWFIHWDRTFFKVWLISYYFCSVSGNNAAPLLAYASQHYCDTTIVLRRRPVFFHIRTWLILLLLISKWTHTGNSEMPGLQLII